MAQQWYYAKAGKEHGPVSSAELQRMADSGGLMPADQVWRDGLRDWVPAAKVKGIRFPTLGGDSPVFPIEEPPQTGSASEPLEPASGSGPIDHLPLEFVPDSPPAPEAPPASAPVANVRRKRGRGLLATVLAVLVLGAGSAGMFVWWKSRAIRPVAVVPANNDAQGNALRKELQDERSRMRDEVRALEERKNELERDKRALERNRDEIKQQINDLVSRRDLIQSFRKCDFVLLDPEQACVGIADAKSDLRVLAKAGAQRAGDVAAACRKWGVPRIRADKALVRNAFENGVAGAALPVPIANQIRAKHWKPWAFVPQQAAAANAPLEFVAFRDRETYQFRLGVLAGPPNNNGFRMVTLRGGNVDVPYLRIQPGSLVRRPAEQLLESLGDVDFLDYCLLRVAQKLTTEAAPGQPNAAAGFLQVALHVEVDIPEAQQVLAESFDEELRYRGQNGGLLWFLGSLFGRKVNYDVLLKGDLQNLTGYVRDDAVTKLTALGVPAVVLPPIHEVANLADAIRHLDVTHAVVIRINRAADGGDYSLGVQLLNASGEILWADNGDRVLDTDGVGHQFQVHSGRLMLLKVKKDHAAGFVGQEEFPVVPVLKPLALDQRNAHLVFLESADGQNPVEYRTLFSHKRLTVPAAHVESIAPIRQLSEVPQDHILRHLVCRIASDVLPSAGRVLKIDNKQGRAEISLGRAHGVKAGDTLRIVRVSDAGPLVHQGLALKGAEALLPTEIRVIEADEHTSLVALSPTGFETFWPENVPLTESDLVIAKARGTRVVQVAVPGMVAPSPKVYTRVGLNNPVVRQRFEKDTGQSARQFAELMEAGLAELKVPVILMESSGSSRSPTHHVGGSITLSPKMNLEARSAANPIYRFDLKVIRAGSQEVVDGFDFDLKDFILPSRRPKK